MGQESVVMVRGHWSNVTGQWSRVSGQTITSVVKGHWLNHFVQGSLVRVKGH